MPRCIGIKNDSGQCTRQATTFTNEHAPHLHYCGIHWDVYNRHVELRRRRTVIVADQHHRQGQCHKWITGRWCTQGVVGDALLCVHHILHAQRREEAAQHRREVHENINRMLDWYRAQQLTWRQVMDHLFTHRTDLHIAMRYEVAREYYADPAVVEPQFASIQQFLAYYRWNVNGRVGDPPDLLNLPIIPPPPPPPPRQDNLAAIAADRQNVHTRAVSQQTNSGLDKLLEVSKVQRNMRSPEWFAAKWLVRGYGHWTNVQRTVNDMLQWYAASSCKKANDYLYRRTLDGLYISLQNVKDTETRSELYKRVFEECYESVGMCCEGHISRLCNVLVGFDETFTPPVPFGEILQNKMAAIAGLEVDAEEKIRQATEFFNEFAVPEAERTAWLEAF